MVYVSNVTSCCTNSYPHVCAQRGFPASLDEVKSAVYEQWLFSDMKESGEPFLPSNLTGIQAQFVKGDFCLQVSSRPWPE